MSKTIVTCYIEAEIRNKAQARRINVSQTLEEALKKALIDLGESTKEDRESLEIMIKAATEKLNLLEDNLISGYTTIL